jgi:hypothetical protein
MLLLELWASFGFEPELLQVVLRDEQFPATVSRDTQKFIKTAFWQFNSKSDYDQA